jgi:hypothetical protein
LDLCVRLCLAYTKNMSAPSTDTAAVRTLIRALRTGGFTLESVYNGEEFVKVTNERQAIEAVTSVDFSSVCFRDSNGKRRSFDVVLGNSEACDVIPDWGIGNPDFDKIISDLVFSW